MRLVCLTTASAVMLGQIPLAVLLPHAAMAQAPVMTRADYEACQAGTETAFRAAVEQVTLRGLQSGIATIDYRAVVNEEWRRNNLDDVIDREVDKAINEVKEETSWGKLLQSLASKDKAQELAVTVAERVFKSEGLKQSIEQLATGVGRAIGKRIEGATTETAEPAMQCMQAFLGPRYGSTVARVVSRDAGKEYAINANKAGAEVSTGKVLSESGGGMAGAVILVVRRQLANLASRIGARVVGSVLSRLVSVVAGGVGVVLIAKDIWEFRNGVLPIIASEMKSKETKDKVQDELAKAISEQIGENLREIAAKTADRVLDIWNEFRRTHAKILDLAETSDKFKRFLDSVRPEAMARLDEVVGLVLVAEGEPAILKRLDDGTLNLAVNKLPAAAIEIARETRSLETGLRWSAIAGDDVQTVLEMEIHRRTKPETFTRAGLQLLLGLKDKLAITRVAAQTPEVRASLFELGVDDLKGLARALSESELAALSQYMVGLEKSSAQRVLRAVAQTPSRMQILARSGVREAVVGSRDQAAAVAMMLKSDVVPDPWMVAEHARLVVDGKVSPILLWEKHPIFVGLFGLFALIVLLMLKRLLFGRRSKVIVQHVPAPAASASAPPIKTAQRA